MLNFDGIIVIIGLAFVMLSLYKEIIGPALTFTIAVATFGIFGILTPQEIIGGFANVQLAVIVLLLIIGDTIRRTSVIELMFDKVFKGTKTYKGFSFRMMSLVALFSAFLNNTPLVAVTMPYVHSWCKKHGISPSKLLIPLSYAAILGGCATLIGTSTNLIVSGFVIDQKIIPDLAPLNLFDFVWVGLPMVIIGIAFLVIFGNKLLPNKTDLISDFSNNTRSYVFETQIRANSKLIGKTIQDAGLRNLKGMYLFEILRNNYRIRAVSSNIILEEGDNLFFAGDTENIADIVNSNMGLTIPSIGMLSKKKYTEVVEIVISHNSSLISKTVKEINFRAKYDSAIIGIHRNGERLEGKIGNVKLKAGDVLLLLAGNDLTDRSNYTQDFYFISKIREVRRLGVLRTIVLLGGLGLAIILSAFKIIPLFMGILILIVVILGLKIDSPKDLHKSVDYNLILIIAMALALGTAMIKTGVAELFAHLIISLFMPFGEVSLLIGIYIITAILAAYMTNIAAVALIFPISLTMASNLALTPMPFVLIVSLAAAANFMTPIGYQTNLMVYGPGGYSFKDYMKIGLPLTILYMVVTVTILTLMYF
jgi:di/tricarboxylate transporter